jgi:hypothetical protein
MGTGTRELLAQGDEGKATFGKLPRDGAHGHAPAR